MLQAQQRAIRELWIRGNLSYKFHSAQTDIYNKFKSTDQKIFVINCARRIGKSFFKCSVATEAALSKRFAQVRFAAPTVKALKNIVLPLFRQVLHSCPKTMAPKFNKVDNVYTFPNGSEIHLAGVNGGNAESLRGTGADLCIVDEAGFVDELDYLVKDIFLPQLIYNPKGKILIGSTPPISPAHDFVKYLLEAEILGSYVHKTIYDNPMITESIIEEYARECGGKETTTFRREFMAEVVTEASSAVVPEFTEEAEKRIVKATDKPSFFNSFTIGDLGFKDATAILFGYYNFDTAQTIIEDELILHAPSSREIAEAILEKEYALWGQQKVYQRFADGDFIVLQDLSKEHGVSIAPVRKDVLEAQVNQLRLDIQQDRLRINPRCKTTIAHLKYGIWDSARKKFDRSSEFYHFDALAALIYFVRHISRQSNPYPWNNNVSIHTHHIPADRLVEDKHKELLKILRRG